MHKRKLTPRMAQFLALAKQHNLPNPLGRAVYCANRAYNAGNVVANHNYIGWNGTTIVVPYDPTQPPSGLRVMQACKATTAARWLRHWQAGGSVKTLAVGTNYSQRQLANMAGFVSRCYTPPAYGKGSARGRAMRAATVALTTAYVLANGRYQPNKYIS